MQGIVWLGDFFFVLYYFGGKINHVYFQLMTWQGVAIFPKSAAIIQPPPTSLIGKLMAAVCQGQVWNSSPGQEVMEMVSGHNEWGVLALTEPGVDVLHPSCLDCERQRLFSAHQSCTETIWGALFRNLQLYTLLFFLSNSVILEGYTWQVVFSSLFFTLCQLVTIYWADWVEMEKELIAFTKSSC